MKIRVWNLPANPVHGWCDLCGQEVAFHRPPGRKPVVCDFDGKLHELRCKKARKPNAVRR